MISKKAVVKAAAKSKIGHLVSYLLDQKGKTDRVAAVAVMNCHCDDPKWAVHEMQAVQGRNQRAKGDRTYHLVISFRSGEDPSRETLARIEDEFAQALGYGEHQRVCVVHRDTDNVHLHVAINKIHPTKFTLHEPFNDYHTRAKLCQKLETRYGLQPDGATSKRDLPAQQNAAAMERVAGVESLIGYVQRSLKTAVVSARTWQELHEAFAKAGVVLKARGNGLVVESNGKTAKASSCFRELSKSALEKRLGQYQEKSQSSSKAATPGKTYSARPLQEGSARLYERYQAARSEAGRAQSRRIAEALAAHRQRMQHAKAAYKVQRTIIGLTRRSTVNTMMLQLHRANLKAKVAASFAAYRAERSVIYREARLLAWNDWLMAQAAKGDQPARTLLQSRQAAKNSPSRRGVPILPVKPTTKSNVRPDYQRPDLAKAGIPIRPDYRRPDLPRAPLPARPDYGSRRSIAARLLGRAAALLQSGLGRSGRKGPARPFASVRDVSGVDVVYDLPRTEMLLRSHEPDRLGSEVGGGTDPAMRRQGDSAGGIGGQAGEGTRQRGGEGQAQGGVSPASPAPYATRNGTLRGASKTPGKSAERAKGWTKER